MYIDGIPSEVFFIFLRSFEMDNDKLEFLEGHLFMKFFYVDMYFLLN